MHRIPQPRWLALLLAAFVLAGCDVWQSQDLKPVPETLTHGRLVYLANRDCKREEHKARTFKVGKTPGQTLKRLQTIVVGSNEHLLFLLRGLAPPPADAVAYRQFLGNFNQEDLVLNHAIEVLAAHEFVQVKYTLKRLNRIDRRLTNRADALGLDACSGTDSAKKTAKGGGQKKSRG
jgi:hypothetical protein